MTATSHLGTGDGPITAPAASAAGAVPAWTRAQPPEIRAPLEVSGPATGSTAAWGRRRLCTWLAVDLTDGDLIDDVALVVYEALANAADHAYPRAGQGPVRLRAHRTRYGLHLTVADDGVWQDDAATGSAMPSTAARDLPVRGRGLPLIRMLMPDVHVEHDASGTTVHLRAPLPPPVFGQGQGG